MRVFIAIPLSIKTKQKLANHLGYFKKNIKQEINWVKPDNLHITLKFIGQIEANELSKIDQDLIQIKKQIVSQKIYFTHVGLMPSYNPKIIYVKIYNNQLYNIMELINKNLIKFTDNKKNIPHLTLGRIKNSLTNKNINIIKNYPINISETFRTFILFQSILTPHGPIYRPVKEYIL